jgi:hypothetical protein
VWALWAYRLDVGTGQEHQSVPEALKADALVIEKQQCSDCKLELPLKQFARYRGVRHPLCRTCLAVDVAEFKDWVLPFVEQRRAALDTPWNWEPWEFAVNARLELSGKEKAMMIRRNPRMAQCYRPRAQPTPETLRPWKFNLVGV